MRPSDGRGRIALALLLIAGGAGCAPAMFTPPTGPGQPAPAAASIWQAVTSHCDTVTSVRAELAVTGRAGGRSIPGLAGARVGTAVDEKGDLAIELYVSGQLAARMAGPEQDATLLLRDGARVVHAPAADIVEALVGVRLDPALWKAVLTRCPATSSAYKSAASYGQVLAVTTNGPVVYLERKADVWSLRAVRWPDVSVDYVTNGQAFSVMANETRLAFTVRDLEISPSLGASAFNVHVPDGAEVITLDQLRQEGPLAR